MKLKLFLLKIAVLTVLYFGYENLVKAQKDTIPPVIVNCNDTFNIQIGSVWVEPFYPIIDNQSDSAHITVVRTWSNNGPVNSLLRSTYIQTIEATDTNGNKATCNIYYKVDDFIPPVITLNTPDTICHLIRKRYNSVMSEVTDNYYPASQVSLQSGTNANFNVAGLYQEVFKATDPSLNVAYKTRYIIVSPDCGSASVNKFYVHPFIIYPNPAINFIQIDLMDMDNPLELKIIAMDGKTVFEASLTNHLKIYTGSFSNGVYTIILSDHNKLFRQNLVVQH